MRKYRKNFDYLKNDTFACRFAVYGSLFTVKNIQI